MYILYGMLKCSNHQCKSYSSGIAQYVKVPNSNLTIATLMPTLGIMCCCVFGKTINANISTSGGAAQWIRTQVGNRKVVSSQFGS